MGVEVRLDAIGNGLKGPLTLGVIGLQEGDAESFLIAAKTGERNHTDTCGG